MAPEKPTFPAVVGCPLCHQPQLYLFDDIATDGIWLHCESCRAHGDILTFAALIWNTSLADSLTRFSDMGVIARNEGDRAAGEYSRAANRARAAIAFWADAEGQCWNHGDDIIACRLRELGLDRDISACRGLVGVAHPDQVATYCSEVGKTAPARMREHGTSLVFPFYDLPGRLTGFLIVQYNDAFQSRRVFVPAMLYRKRKPDAGYYLLHTATLPAPKALRDSFFILDDPFSALKAQTAQARAGAPLLPIAAAYHGSDAVSYGNNWTAFPSTPRFFHGPVISPELVSQAAAARGYVCVLPNEQIERTATPSRTLMRLAAIRKQARTWQQSLEIGLKDMSELAAQAFCNRLLIPHDRLHLFFAERRGKFSPEYGARMLAHVEAPPIVPTKVHRRWVVIERDGGWWTHTGQHVCNARVEITRVIRANNGETLYTGIIDTATTQLTFTDTAKKIEQMGLLAFAAQHAAAAGILIRYDRAWNARAHLISMQLHEPELVHVSGRLGWDEKANQFCFYDYALTNNGEIVPAAFPNVRHDRCANFPRPDVLPPLSLRPLLTVSEDNSFIWSIFSAIVAQLVAPIVGKPAPIVALNPKAFDAALQVGAALDCPQLRIPSRGYVHCTQKITGTLSNAEWPTFISHSFNDKFFSTTVPRAIEGQGFVRLLDACAKAAPSYGWHWLAAPPPETLPKLDALRFVLPAYVQYVLQARAAVLAGENNTLLAILQGVAGWLDETHGATFNQARALNYVFTPARAHEILMSVCNDAILAGKLDVLPRPRRKDQPRNYLLRNKNNWWLNQPAIDRYFYSVGKLAPNWSAVTELLQKNHLLCGEETIHETPGILVNREWCDQFWSDYNPQSVRETG